MRKSKAAPDYEDIGMEFIVKIPYIYEFIEQLHIW